MKLSNEQLTELVNLVDIKLDRMLTPLTPETEFQTWKQLLETLRSELNAREEATPKRPRLATYYILTGEKYWVEATSEEEALNKFHKGYEGNEPEAEYIEADTVVVGHD